MMEATKKPKTRNKTLAQEAVSKITELMEKNARLNEYLRSIANVVVSDKDPHLILKCDEPEEMLYMEIIGKLIKEKES